jgi:hypothetical protein
VAVSIGLVLLFLAPLARWYVLPRVKKIPTDYYYRAVSVGRGSYLNPQGFTVVGPVPLEDVHIVKGDVAASSKTVAVWDSFDSTFDTQNHHQLSYSVDRYTFDRTTATAVKCCGENEDRKGTLTLLFPIGAEKHSYDFWDSTAKRAFPAVYQDTETLAGLTVYHYHQVGGPVRLKTQQLTGKILGLPSLPTVQADWMYTVTTDLWVDPLTGAIVKGTQSNDQWFAVGGARKLTIATTSFSQSDQTVRGIADFVKTQRGLLLLVQRDLPLYGALAGVILVAVGLVLLAPPRERARAFVEPVPAASASP